MNNRKRFVVVLFAFAFLLGYVLTVSVFAQDLSDLAKVDMQTKVFGIPKPLFAQLVNIAIGAAITALVSFLKSSDYIGNHPKVAAALLAIIGSLATGLADVHATEGVIPYVTTFFTQLVTAIGTFEIVKAKSDKSD